MKSKSVEYRIFLCDSQKIPIDEINYIEIDFASKFGVISNELTFSLPYYQEGWDLEKDYRFDTARALDSILLEIYSGKGGGETTKIYEEFFIVDDDSKSKTRNGTVTKVLQCNSSHLITFNKRKLRSYSEITKLYTTEDQTGLFNHMFSLLYGSWGIGYISPSLLLDTRIFDYSSSSFTEVFDDVMEQFNCFITVDNINNTISIFAYDEVGVDTDLVISDVNILKSILTSNKAKDLTTRLRVYGKDNTTMARSNPTGQLYIDDFQWLIDNGYFSTGLTIALNAYNVLKASKEGVFSGYLTTLNGLQDTLLTQQSQLFALQTELKIIEDDLDILKNQFTSNNATYNARFVDQTNKLSQINTKQSEINTTQASIVAVNISISTLNTQLSYTTNFTSDQLKELSSKIYEEELSLDTIDNPQLLYDYGIEYLIRKSIPIIDIDVDLIDILGIEEFKLDWEKWINVKGNFVYIDCPELGFNYYQTRVVQMAHNPLTDSLNLTISNADQINSYLYRINRDILKKSKQSSNELNVNKYDYKQYVTEKSQIIFNGDTIDTSDNAIKVGNSVINRRGFLGTDGTSMGSYGALQLLGDKIIISRNGFTTYSTLLSGNGLYLENFNRKARIVIDPDFGLQTDMNVGTFESPIWNNTLYFGVDGNLNVSGNIIMDGGSINWGNVTAPTATEVGAKPYDWLPAYGDISGIKPPTNADNTSGFVGQKLTYIDAFGIYTGTLTANQINVIQGITLGANATINWASLPSLPSASQVGAMSNGTFIPDDDYITQITKNTITTDYLKANFIETNISQVNETLNLGAYGSVGTKMLSFRGTANISSIDNDLNISARVLSIVQGDMIFGVSTTHTYCGGTWDFTGVNVQNLNVTAKFG